MAASISQSVGTKDMLDNGLCALSDAVHSLCDILDLSHASIILSHTSNLVDRFEPCSTSWVQFLLAKSHYLLVTGKVWKIKIIINPITALTNSTYCLPNTSRDVSLENLVLD